MEHGDAEWCLQNCALRGRENERDESSFARSLRTSSQAAVRRMRLGPQTTSPTFLFQSFHILDTFYSMCNIRNDIMRQLYFTCVGLATLWSSAPRRNGSLDNRPRRSGRRELYTSITDRPSSRRAR